MYNEPKYDEDVVNLGYLNKILGGSIDKTNEDVRIPKTFATQPKTPYSKGDIWIDGKYIYVCVNSRNVGLFNINDWTTESGAKDLAVNKSKVYTTQPTNYQMGDMWILQTDNDHPLGKKGEILIADKNGKEYIETDWVKEISYITQDEKTEIDEKIQTATNRIAELKTTSSQISARVQETEVKLNDTYTKEDIEAMNGELSEDLETVSKRVGSLEVSSKSVSAKVESIENIVTDVEEKAVIKVKVLYALGDSSTTAPEDGWSETAPEWQNGKYMWQKTATTNGVSTTYSEPTCIQGAKGQDGTNGKDGTNGEDGKSTYQIWLDAGNTGTEEDFLASLKGEQGIQGLQGLQGEKGEQGIPGPKGDTGATGSKGDKGDTGAKGDKGDTGTSGATSYFHIKYSPVANPTASQMTETPNIYIGTYVDFTEKDSTNPNDYTWYKVIGDDGKDGVQGPQGEQGIPGTNGSNGQTSYLHIKYSNDGGKTFTENNGETVGTYIGQYVDFTKADSTNVSDYTWAEIKGDTGIGVKAIEAQYYLSTSNTTQSGGEWKNSQDEWQSGKYYWTRSKITWTDDTVEYTNPELAEGLNNANNTASEALNNTNVINTTEEAKEFYLTDSADSNCKSVEIFGESTQDTRSGKNLLPYPYTQTTRTTNGITFTDNGDGTITVVGTNDGTGVSNFYFKVTNTFVLPEGTYIMSDDGQTVPLNGDLGYIFVGPNANGLYISDGTTPQQYCVLQIPLGKTINKTIKPQIELGTTPTSWEQYGAMPSPEFPSEIKSVSGKNLIPFPYYNPSITRDGVELTVNSDGSITANGTATAEGGFTILARSSDPIPLKAGKYTYSGVTDGSSTTWYLQMYKNSVGQVVNATSPTTITAEDGDVINQISLFYKKGAVFNNVVIKPQLEKGDKATFYVPYNHIEFKSTGKNLCDKIDYWDTDNKLFGMKSVKTINSWTGPYFDLQSICEKNNLKIGDKVTASIYFKTNFVPNRNMSFTLYRANAASSNINKTILASSVIVGEWQRLSFTFDITEYSLSSQKCRIECDYYDTEDPYYFGNNRTNAVWFACPQLELGNEATEFEDLKENTTAIPLLHDMRSLPNGARDRIYYEDGKWYDEQKIIEKIVTRNESNWYNNTDNDTENTKYYQCTISDQSISYGMRIVPMLSNYFRCDKSAWSKVDEERMSLQSNNGVLMIKINQNTAPTLDDLKNWLDEHELKIIYELAEPIITEITDEDTIKALESIKTYKGITNITADANSILTYYRDVPIVDEYETKADANKKQEITIQKFAKQEITNDEINSKVSKITETYQTKEEAYTQYKQLDDSFTFEVNKAVTDIKENGVSKVNTMQVTIDDEGLLCGKSDSGYTNRMNNEGNYQYNAGQLIAKYDKNGAEVPRLKSDLAIIAGLKIVQEEAGSVKHIKAYIIG